MTQGVNGNFAATAADIVGRLIEAGNIDDGLKTKAM